MNVLAIDATTYASGVALARDGQVMAERTTILKKNHSLRLMPAVEELMNEVGMSPAELDRIVVAKGPGSYTGVRIAVGTAKSLAWSLGIPIVGVSSLETLAANAKLFPGWICPFFDARRGQVYTGLYHGGAALQSIEADQIVLMEEFARRLKERDGSVFFLSPDVLKHQEVIRDVLGERALFADEANLFMRPAELVRLGMEREPEVDTHAFAPAYVQLAEAEKKWLASQAGADDE
ncbi:tRNA (adenosine(37)-N6)-threonylcarbamoyltransferase complex dimerization subunit type 1 TsaB [Salsuginibacillus kocurii]|uniref:tRNA (adenosine(37)-N6)-threonylcarbamoyltransferase complex dimerization subunit type 1 TsaB n=1 Tax=Salsuginibacillus kocurii TaxID=427078 RepID=UPI000375C504|nr:tRNA (adenosine(37)-N6)-threonylcarbamoyltransferase complex dimerization subunit type 1 TsaB [Salsuginibacillus kocurii]